MGNTQRTKLTMLGTSDAETFMGVPALGGDDSVPLPVLRALERYRDVTVLQIDATGSSHSTDHSH